MKQRSAAQSKTSMLTNRGLMIGLPLLVSLVFSGIYTVSQQPRNGQTASTATLQKESNTKNIQVVTPPAASKLTTEPVTATDMSSSSATKSGRKSSNQAQSSTDAVENVQKSTKQTPQPASIEDSAKLQHRAKF